MGVIRMLTMIPMVLYRARPPEVSQLISLSW